MILKNSLNIQLTRFSAVEDPIILVDKLYGQLLLNFKQFFCSRVRDGNLDHFSGMVIGKRKGNMIRKIPSNFGEENRITFISN